jgi:hypothetical protein
MMPRAKSRKWTAKQWRAELLRREKSGEARYADLATWTKVQREAEHQLGSVNN